MNSTPVPSNPPREHAPQRWPAPDATRLIPAVLGAYAFVGGLLALTGWLANIPRLTDWTNAGTSMMPNAAVCATAAGAALLLRVFTRAREPVTLLGVFVGVIGATTLFQQLTGITLGIDTVFHFPEWGHLDALAPARMGLPASTSWTIIGLSLVLTSRGLNGRRAATAGGMLVAAIAMLSLVGFLFGANLLFAHPRLTAIALQTATTLLAVGLGVIATLPDQQPMKTLCADTTAGLLARRTLPWIVVVPLVLGWLRVRGQEAGLFDPVFGSALRTLIEMGFLLALFWWMLAKVAAKETALRREQNRVTETLESIADGFHVIDAEERFIYFNDAGRKMYAAQGLATADLLGRRFFEVFPDARDIEVGRAIQRTLSEHTVTEAENFYAPWQRWFAVRNHPTPEGGVATYFQDITERKIANERLHQRHRQLDVLSRVSHELVFGGKPEAAMLHTVFESVREVVGTEYCFNYLVDEKSNTLQLVSSGGLSAEQKDFFATIRFGEYLCGTVAARRERLVVENLQECGFPEADALCAAGVKCYAGFPLLADGRLLGTVAFAALTRERFRDGELQMIQTASDQAAATLDRARLIQQLRESEERYRDLFNSMDEGYCVIEMIFDAHERAVDYRFVEVNRAFEKQTGLRDATGKRMREFSPNHEAHWFETYGQISLTGEPRRFVSEAKALDRCFDVYAFRVGGPGSRSVAVLFTDITKQRKNEEALRHSEQSYRALVTTTSDVVYRMSPNWSEMRALDGRGFIVDSPKGNRAWLQEYIHPDDHSQVMAAIREATHSRSIFELEHRIRRVDGTWGWTFSRAIPLLDAQCEIVEWFGAASDVTGA